MFEPITLKWRDKEFRVPANNVMDLIDRIENHVTVDEIHRMQVSGAIKRMQIARAYAEALQFAMDLECKGEEIDAQDVYADMFSEKTAISAIGHTLFGLLQMLIPPSAMDDDRDEKKTAKKVRKGKG